QRGRLISLHVWPVRQTVEHEVGRVVHQGGAGAPARRRDDGGAGGVADVRNLPLRLRAVDGVVRGAVDDDVGPAIVEKLLDHVLFVDRSRHAGAGEQAGEL